MILRSILSLLTLFSVATAEAATKTVTLTKDNTLVMNTYFEPDTVAKVALRAKELDAILPTNEPLYLVINSGGGDIDAGIELIENLNNLNRPVHTITLFSASMGFQTVQGVKGKRLITNEGTLMSHKARGGFYGEFPGQLDSRYGYYLRRVTNLDSKVVKRTNGKHTAKSYATLIENEYWCDGADCITQGFADAVVRPACDKSLEGTKVESEKFFFAGFPIEIQLTVSKCPTVSGVIDWQVLIGGEPMFKKDDKETRERYQYATSNAERLTKEQLATIDERVRAIIEMRSNKSKLIVKKY